MGLIAVTITSFGYGHRPAPDATITLDVRTLLRDPHATPALRQLTGADPAVRRAVLSTPGAADLVRHTADLVARLVAEAGNPAGELVTVAVGYVGGRHRSVALADAIGLLVECWGIGVDTFHLDIGSPVLDRGRAPQALPGRLITQPGDAWRFRSRTTAGKLLDAR